MGIDVTDLFKIGLLVVLEGLLSADNALVLAVLVLVLPEEERKKALRYGILGAFVLRIAATIFARALIELAWVKLVGALYLLYLPVKHFWKHPHDQHEPHPRAGTILGLSLFWSTVVKVDLIDLVFAVDSILAAIGLSNKLWVVITGGLLGILAMRLVVGQLLAVVKRYPALIDGAYVIIAWVGFKLIVEYFHNIHVLPNPIPEEIAVGVVLILFLGSYLYARAKGPAEEEIPEGADEAERLIS
jgi:YkoY family integral membrane protein